MAEIVDFFFSPYRTAQQRRMQAALEDGLAHGSRIEPPDPLPGEAVTLIFSTPVHLALERVAVYYTTDGTEPLGEKGEAVRGQVVLAGGGEAEELVLGALVQATRQWRVVLPAQSENTLVRYRADAWSVRDPRLHRYADSADPISVSSPRGRVFAYDVDAWVPPAWWRDAVVYQVFVDRFSAGHDEPPLLEREAAITSFFGGTLRGVLEKLDYIEALGINCLWLSPVFASPIYHGYNPSDYYAVSQHYGGDEALTQLIQEAHRRGMRVVLDYVANHTSDEHPMFLAAQRDAGGSGARWYDFGDGTPHGYRSYAHVRAMPELLTDNPEVQRYLFDAALHWLGHFGADGLRLDYVPGPSHAFWALLQRDVKQHFPEAITIGEVTAPMDEIALYAGRMDAFMDFPLAGMLRRVFALRTAALADLIAFLATYKLHIPASMQSGTLLDNHDMHRFLWLAEGDIARLKLAALCHMTLEGTPIVYYGTEVGLSQYADAYKENAYARAPMLWGEQQDQDLLAYYRRLIELRHAHTCLRYGSLQTLPPSCLAVESGDERQIGVYIREWEGESLLIVLNNNKQAVKLRVRLSEPADDQEHPPVHNLLAADAEPLAVHGGQIELMLPALDGALISKHRSLLRK